MIDLNNIFKTFLRGLFTEAGAKLRNQVMIIQQNGNSALTPMCRNRALEPPTAKSGWLG